MKHSRVSHWVRNTGATGNRAFTLIEVLVVVSIIALLIAILLPALRSAREQGKTAVCLANQKALGTASIAYLGSNNNRYCWGAVNTTTQYGYPRSHYYGGASDKGDGDGGKWDTYYGPTSAGGLLTSTNPGGSYIPAGTRPVNKYVMGRGIGRLADADLQVYHCPSDDGVRDRSDFTLPKSKNTTYHVLGTSYDTNVTWFEYVRRREYVNNLPPGAPAHYRQRAFQLMDRLIYIFEKKGASRGVLLYEDPADCTLGGVLYDWPPNLRYMGWHQRPNYYTALFLDGHSENLQMDYRRVLDYDFSGPNGAINLTCNPAFAKCRNGDANWVVRQDYWQQ
jgi:prepilin-type N-terminal cleavage/methylation domain-containing protein